MVGHLDLGSPWTEDALAPSLRNELRKSIPDGWTIGLSASGPPGPRTTYKAWANDGRAKETLFALYVTRSKDAGHAILEVLQWIHDNETWTLGPFDAQ